jgi:hypothetical protein
MYGTHIIERTSAESHDTPVKAFQSFGSFNYVSQIYGGYISGYDKASLASPVTVNKSFF